jgi:predicted nuclease of predicted toxin-antitoxin system
MIIWLDAQLPPQLAVWIRAKFLIDATAIRDLGLRDAKDSVIFEAARKANAVLLSKDADFLEMVLRNGPPPKLMLLNCGNVSNLAMQLLLEARLGEAMRLLDQGESIVEIG